MVKEEFPILSQSVNEKPLIYLDNASTTQKPSSVINEIQNYDPQFLLYFEDSYYDLKLLPCINHRNQSCENFLYFLYSFH